MRLFDFETDFRYERGPKRNTCLAEEYSCRLFKFSSDVCVADRTNPLTIICHAAPSDTHLLNGGCLKSSLQMWIQASRVPAAMSVPVPEMVSSMEAANKCSLVVIDVLLRFPNKWSRAFG